MAFHSYYMKGIAPALKEALDKVGMTRKQFNVIYTNIRNQTLNPGENWLID